MRCENCGEIIEPLESGRCPNCDILIKEDAVADHEVESIISEILSEEEEATKNQDIDKKSADKKTTRKKSFGKKTPKVPKKPMKRSTEITRYITIGILLLTLLSVLFPWFSITGRGAVIGYQMNVKDEIYIKNLNPDIANLSQNSLLQVGEDQIVATFSPIDLVNYANAYEDAYRNVYDINGKEETSIVATIHILYIRGILVFLLLIAIAIVLLIVDKRLYTIEWNRGGSIFSLFIIGLNYIALKIPFFSMFASRTRSALRLDNYTNAVSINFNGIGVNNEFYPYGMVEEKGLFFALVVCIFWLVLTTVLIEMKKEHKEDTEQKDITVS